MGTRNCMKMIHFVTYELMEQHTGFSNLAGARRKSTAASSICAGYFLYSKSTQFCFTKLIVIWSFWGNKRQLLKIIKKQCGYNYMYLLIFEARAFFGGKLCSCARTLIWTCMYRRGRRFVLTRKLQHEAEAANDVVFSVSCGEVSKRNRWQ